MTRVLCLIFDIQMNNGQIVHIETREGNNEFGEIANVKMDALLRVDIKHGNLINFLKALRRSSFLSSVNLLSTKTIDAKSAYYSNKYYYNYVLVMTSQCNSASGS